MSWSLYFTSTGPLLAALFIAVAGWRGARREVDHVTRELNIEVDLRRRAERQVREALQVVENCRKYLVREVARREVER